MTMKNETVQIRISEADKDELNELAEKLDIPVSQIIRDGIRKQMASLREAAAAETEEATAGVPA